MDFTREPIIESIITPKDGCKLVVRSSKAAGQEEFFVDSLEVVSFSNALFYRSLEKPKAFLVPVTDYEILEVREPRLVLKNVGLDRSIKIGGGREAVIKLPREQEKTEAIQEPQQSPESLADEISSQAGDEAKEEGRSEKKRDRRRHFRRRRGREEAAVKEEGASEEEPRKIDLPAPKRFEGKLEGSAIESVNLTTSMLSSLLPPPPNLISETLSRYKENDHFKGVFFKAGEEREDQSEEDSSKDERSPSEEEAGDPDAGFDSLQHSDFEGVEEPVRNFLEETAISGSGLPVYEDEEGISAINASTTLFETEDILPVGQGFGETEPSEQGNEEKSEEIEKVTDSNSLNSSNNKE